MADDEEFVAYSESSPGFLLPIIAIQHENGSSSFRDMVRDDLGRISDDISTPGGWLFKLSNNNSWARRFAVIRGPFLFYFRSPEADRPVGIIPLMDCTVGLAPEGTTFGVNEGFEFELRNFLGHIIRLYAQTASERDAWMYACKDRIERYKHSTEALVVTLPESEDGSSSNIYISSCKLLPYVPPTPPDSVGSSPSRGGSFYSTNSYSPQPPTSTPPPPSSQTNFVSPPVVQQPPYTPPQGTPSYMATPEGSVAQSESRFSYATQGSNYTGRTSQSPIPPPPVKDIDANSVAYQLEKGLQGKFTIQKEASAREAVATAKHNSQPAISKAKAIEVKNPLHLSELIRVMLFFADEELTEDPTPEAPMQIPRLKGAHAENMLVSVYQYYCNPRSGFMSLEEFVMFIEDSGLLRTHTPHDENDLPLSELKAMLDPIQLLTMLPRGLVVDANKSPNQKQPRRGMTSAEGMTRRLSVLSKVDQNDDAFMINFTQFYELLVRITEIIYPDLWANDKTVAMNKILLETILPMYVWSQGHAKIGSDDALVREERIALLFNMYLPNLWRVFLFYAQDVNGKIPAADLPFPLAAQEAERMLFGLPKGTINRAKELEALGYSGEPYIMTLAGILRLCIDYGLTPHLISKEDIRKLVIKLNGPKQLINLKTFKFKTTKEISDNLSTASSKSKNRILGKVGHVGLDQTPGSNGGLGFSEFIEFLGTVAMEGLRQENYHVIYPTPYSKVLALLSIWRLADLDALEEVRTISSKTFY